MKYNKLIIGGMVLALLVVAFSSSGFAFAGFGHGRMMYNNVHPGFNENQQAANPLNLTEEQRDILREERDIFVDERLEMQTELRNLNLELRELLVSDGTDEDIANIKNKINILQNNLLDLKTDYWLGLGEVLTEEQIEQAKELFVNQEDGATYPRGPGMGMYGFRGQRMLGSGFNGGGRSQMFPNSRICPFEF